MDNTMYLKIFIDTDEQEVIDTYNNHIEKHNTKLDNDAPYEDSGFDLYIPESTTFTGNSVTKVNLKIKCSAYVNNRPCGFYVYPRSSISKTPLRLANHVGIIDAGYRGCLIGAFDNIREDEYHVEANTRLLQICGPFLQSIRPELVSCEEELGYTNRGTGGFGSTGTTDPFSSIGSLEALGKFASSLNNTQQDIDYMDIARQMDQIIFKNNQPSNMFDLNINDDLPDADLSSLDDLEPYIEPVD
jgi:dUTP pyrophosphatase